MQPTVGRIVHYKLSSVDAEQITRRRNDASAFRRSVPGSAAAGERGRTGHIEHSGGEVNAGDVLPAMITRVYGGTTVSLQVTLDGNDHLWAPSRRQGDEEGQWSWPPRA